MLYLFFVEYMIQAWVHPTCEEPHISNIPHITDNVHVHYIYLPSFNN